MGHLVGHAPRCPRSRLWTMWPGLWIPPGQSHDSGASCCSGSGAVESVVSVGVSPISSLRCVVSSKTIGLVPYLVHLGDLVPADICLATFPSGGLPSGPVGIAAGVKFLAPGLDLGPGGVLGAHWLSPSIRGPGTRAAVVPAGMADSDIGTAPEPECRGRCWPGWRSPGAVRTLDRPG
jgi:hypothetical protein